MNELSTPTALDFTHTFQRFFDISPDLLCIAGFDGYFRKINPSVSAVLGYSNEELYARPINDFIYPADRDLTIQGRNALTKNSPLRYYDNRYVTKSGEIIWLSWTSMPVMEEKLVFAIAKNITHRKQVEVERNELIAKLTTINNNLKQLTYSTSHDLRSPVNSLLTVFNLLDITKIHDEETLALISILKSASEGLSNTLNNYVDELEKKDGLHTYVEMLDLQDSLDVVLFSINAFINDSKATIHVDFSACPQVGFNKTYLESIFLNLLTNAIKYAKPGLLPVIYITSRIENGIRQLVVQDNGLGFDEAFVKNKLFGLYQKLHHHTDSKGIGLYLVHNHVTSLGGTIEVETKLNEGARFIISFNEANNRL